MSIDGHLDLFKADWISDPDQLKTLAQKSKYNDLAHTREGETLIHTLVQLGKALSIETLAEGIEQQYELSLLQDSTGK